MPVVEDPDYERLYDKWPCSVLRLAAGNLTTIDLIRNGVMTMLQDSSELEPLRAAPALLPRAVARPGFSGLDRLMVAP